MNELEAKVKCRFCREAFVLFQDLLGHKCMSLIQARQLKSWLEGFEAKTRSFESVVREDLTKE